MENPDEAPKQTVNVLLPGRLVVTLTKKTHLPVMGIDNIGILIRLVQLVSFCLVLRHGRVVNSAWGCWWRCMGSMGMVHMCRILITMSDCPLPF